ncbi:unnamed protein product [Candida verbasci]|uniref:Major facilitator superfamily (MFS) profile domain-containing protein n=1 Tax=Candida verbasci TaxID=1227364 RepID=A0A9W4TTB2_9ASCO|nr:unnamed protein product [Candida verbasci]
MTVDLVPGTVHLVDVLGNLNVEKEGSGDIILHPQPSSNPNDPLRWSKTKRNLQFALVWFWGFMVAASTNFSGPLFDIWINELNTTLNQLGISIALGFLFLGVGVAIVNPTGLKLGKQFVYNCCTIIMIIASIIGSQAKDINLIYVFKILVGFAASPVDSLVEITSTDLYFQHERSTAFSLLILALYGGCDLGPVAAGYIAENAGWKWCFWVQVIIYAALLVIQVFVMEDTTFRRDFEKDDKLEKSIEDKGGFIIEESCTIIEYEESSWLEKRNWVHTSENDERHWTTIFIRPIFLITFPSTIYAAVVYGSQMMWLSFISNTQSAIYTAEPYYFSTKLTGLTNLGAFLGSVIGMFYGGNFVDYFAVKMARRNNGILEPEHRLYTMIVPTVLNAAGLLAYGLGSYYKAHWAISVVIGQGLLGFAMSSSAAICLTYAVECYHKLTSESLVLILFIRNMFGMGFSFAISPWIARNGLQLTTWIMFMLSIVINGFFIVFIIYDKEKIKRVIPKASNKIIDATVARLYIAYPDPTKWIYTGLSGAIVLVDDLVGHTFFLKLVDIIGHRGVLWDQELYINFDYHQDRKFFHTFEIEDCLVGLLFEDTSDATHFYKRVTNKQKYGSNATVKNKNAIKLKERAVEKSHAPGPRGEFIDSNTGQRQRRYKGVLYYDDVPPPEWRGLYSELEAAGITEDMIAENREFIKDYIAKQPNHPLKGLEPPIPRNYHKPESKPSIKKTKAPPPPPPPTDSVQSSMQSSVQSPVQSPAYSDSPEPEVSTPEEPKNEPKNEPFKPKFRLPPADAFAPIPTNKPLPTPQQQTSSPQQNHPQNQQPQQNYQQNSRPIPQPPSSNNVHNAPPAFNYSHQQPPSSSNVHNAPPAFNYSHQQPPAPPMRGNPPPPPPRGQQTQQQPFQQQQPPQFQQHPSLPPRNNQSGPPPPPPRASRGGAPPAPPPRANRPSHQSLPQVSSPPPPPRNIQPNSHPVAPPLPQQNQQPPPPPPLPQQNQQPPVAPQLPQQSSSMPPPPPPPPMPSNDNGTFVEATGNAGRDALLASIRGSGLGSLKKTNNLQEQENRIKPNVAGTTSTASNSSAPPDNGNNASLADALASALNKRKGKVRQSDDEDDEEW